MEQALLSLLGVLLGLLIGEYFRRKNRVESYSQKVFEKRIEIFHELIGVLQDAYTAADEVIENDALDEGERNIIISKAVHIIADFTDRNALYIDRYIAGQCLAFIMGVDDIPTIENEEERLNEVNAFRSEYRTTIEFLVSESGIQQISKHFRTISKSKQNTEFIKAMKGIEKYGT